MDRLSDISNTTTIPHAFVELRYETLEHGQAVVFSYDIRVISIDTIVIHSVLDIEERHRSVDVDQNHHEDSCKTYLSEIACYSQHNILQYLRPINNVEKMETVVNVRGVFAEQGDAKIEHIVLEGRILDEEVHVHEV